MKTNDMPNFAALMATLGEIYHKPITAAQSEACWEGWKRYAWDDVQRGVMRHLLHPERCYFLPKPGDILRYLVDTPEIQALKAWSKIRAALGTVGGYDSVAFDDPLIHTVIQHMGGWIQLCRSKISEAPFLAREFQKRYRGYLDVPPKYCPAYLCGSIENEYQQQGLNLPPLVQVSECEVRVISICYQNQQQRQQTQVLLAQVQEKYDFNLQLIHAADHHANVLA